MFYSGTAAKSRPQVDPIWGFPPEHYFSTVCKRDTNLRILLGKIFEPKDIPTKRRSWRFKFISSQLKLICKRHQKLPYKSLMDKYCATVDLQRPSSSLGNLANHQVYLFLRATLLRLLPLKLFGHSFNRRQLFKGMRGHFYHQPWNILSIYVDMNASTWTYTFNG